MTRLKLLAALLASLAPLAGITAQPAPAFTAPQLLAPPTNAWITNGGTLFNQRYSPLSLINRDNVKELRALWRTAMGSGTTPGHAGQAQILAYGDALYVSNGANDAFALDVESGAILWSFKGNPEPRAGVAVNTVKDHYKRLRPNRIDKGPLCRAVDDLDDTYAYPSGAMALSRRREERM